jgi:pimeloyl-ACP methyl ester carboxylesterase
MPTVTVNGVRLRYVREGCGEPVLLLHGYLFGADWWRPQIDALKDAYDVVAVDLRGQMGSEVTEDEDGYNLWNQAEDIHALVGELDVAPVHLVGLSMGGMIGMRLCLGYPDDLRSLVLMDTSAAPEEPERAERYAAMREVVEASGVEPMLPALPSIFLADDFIVEHRQAVDGWLDALRGCDVKGVIRTGRSIDTRDDITHRLAEIRVPTLVIHGSDDVAIPLERAQEIAERIPGARLEIVSGGHQSNVDRPDETSRLIREFLATVQSPSASSIVNARN